MEIRPYKPKRSEAQNRLMWKWIDCIADTLGYRSEELHFQLKEKWLGSVEVKGPFGVSKMPRSTTDLTTKEFSEHLVKIEALARELNIALPLSDERDYALGVK